MWILRGGEGRGVELGMVAGRLVVTHAHMHTPHLPLSSAIHGAAGRDHGSLSIRVKEVRSFHKNQKTNQIIVTKCLKIKYNMKCYE